VKNQKNATVLWPNLKSVGKRFSLTMTTMKTGASISYQQRRMIMIEEIPKDATHQRHKHQFYKVTNKVQYFDPIIGEWDDVAQDPYDLEEWLLELTPLTEQPR
jgi:hypothetical protein